MSATTTQLPSSGEFCKLRYDTIPVKSSSVKVSCYNNNSKMPNFELCHSCRKWAIYCDVLHSYGVLWSSHFTAIRALYVLFIILNLWLCCVHHLFGFW